MTRRALLALVLLSALQLLRYHWALGISFINDDFLYLDHARTLDFWRCWNFSDALGNDYRPIPRNLYFWALLKWFGRDPAPYHAVNLALGTGSLWLLFLALREFLARAAAPGAAGADRAAARRGAEAPAVLGTLLFSLHPAGGTPLSWVCGNQDLFSVALALGAVLAHLGRRRVWYVLLFLASLLCKKTAVLLPGVLALHDLLVEHVRWRTALARQSGALAVLVAWARFDPWLPWNASGRQVYASHPGTASLLGHGSVRTLAVTVRSLLLVLPFERFQWTWGWVETELQVAILAGTLWLAAGLAWPRRAAGGVVWVGLAWCAAGILPVVALISRFVYYAYYPALGLTLSAMGLLAWGLRGASRRRVANAVCAAAAFLLFFLGGVAYPPRLIDAHAVRRSSEYLAHLRTGLLAARPALADSTRCYFWGLPYNVGFQVADGPAVRVWTGNPTLQGFYINDYTTSSSRASRFFRGDSLGDLHEVVRGMADPALAAPDAGYAAAHAELGSHLYLAGERAAGMLEWRKALRADPTNGEAAFDLGSALVEAGSAGAALPFLERAATAPGHADGARYYLACALARLGRRDEAGEALRQLLARSPASEYLDRAHRLEASLSHR